MNSDMQSKAVQLLEQLREKWLPKILISVRNDAVEYRAYSDGDWLRLEGDVEQRSIFEQRVLLLPDDLCFHRLRQFPADSLTKQSLREAVELDLPRWSPWTEDVDFFYWPKRQENTWQVAVWVWKKASLASILDRMKGPPGYIVPSAAWKMASLLKSQQSDVLLIESSTDGSWNYTGVADDFSQFIQASVTSDSAGRRLQTTIQQDMSDPACFLDADDLAEVPPWEDPQALAPARYVPPPVSELAAGRQPGVEDWTDPFVWARPVGAVLAVYLLWIVGSGLVFLKQGEEVKAYTERANSISTDVLEARIEVESMNEVLQQLDLMRQRQTHMQAVLASLSQTLPRETWVNQVDYQDDPDSPRLELTGNSRESASLAAVLENMPEVKQAMFLSDIRKNAITGLESFKLQLILAESP